MKQTVILKLLCAIAIAGQVLRAGSLVEVTEDEAKDLLQRGKAELHNDKPHGEDAEQAQQTAQDAQEAKTADAADGDNAEAAKPTSDGDKADAKADKPAKPAKAK